MLNTQISFTIDIQSNVSNTLLEKQKNESAKDHLLISCIGKWLCSFQNAGKCVTLLWSDV